MVGGGLTSQIPAGVKEAHERLVVRMAGDVGDGFGGETRQEVT